MIEEKFFPLAIVAIIIYNEVKDYFIGYKPDLI